MSKKLITDTADFDQLMDAHVPITLIDSIVERRDYKQNCLDAITREKKEKKIDDGEKRKIETDIVISLLLSNLKDEGTLNPILKGPGPANTFIGFDAYMDKLLTSATSATSATPATHTTETIGELLTTREIDNYQINPTDCFVVTDNSESNRYINNYFNNIKGLFEKMFRDQTSKSPSIWRIDYDINNNKIMLMKLCFRTNEYITVSTYGYDDYKQDCIKAGFIHAESDPITKMCLFDTSGTQDKQKCMKELFKALKNKNDAELPDYTKMSPNTIHNILQTIEYPTTIIPSTKYGDKTTHTEYNTDDDAFYDTLEANEELDDLDDKKKGGAGAGGEDGEDGEDARTISHKIIDDIYRRIHNIIMKNMTAKRFNEIITNIDVGKHAKYLMRLGFTVQDELGGKKTLDCPGLSDQGQGSQECRKARLGIGLDLLDRHMSQDEDGRGEDGQGDLLDYLDQFDRIAGQGLRGQDGQDLQDLQDLQDRLRGLEGLDLLDPDLLDLPGGRNGQDNRINRINNIVNRMGQYDRTANMTVNNTDAVQQSHQGGGGSNKVKKKSQFFKWVKELAEYMNENFPGYIDYTKAHDYKEKNPYAVGRTVDYMTINGKVANSLGAQLARNIAVISNTSANGQINFNYSGNATAVKTQLLFMKDQADKTLNLLTQLGKKLDQNTQKKWDKTMNEFKTQATEYAKVCQLAEDFARAIKLPTSCPQLSW